jgi:hypothetical protein
MFAAIHSFQRRTSRVRHSAGAALRKCYARWSDLWHILGRRAERAAPSLADGGAYRLDRAFGSRAVHATADVVGLEACGSKDDELVFQAEK